jgi:hypothetical protein
MDVRWGTPIDEGNYQSSTFEITNDNQGTQYNSFTINSTYPLMNALLEANPQYGSIQEMINGTDSQGRANFRVAINSDSGYVNNGWSVSINENGAIRGVNDNDRFTDKFTFEGIFNGDFAINESLLHNVPLGVVTNAAGAADTAWEMSAQYHATPVWVPGYALSATGLAVRAAQVEVSGVTNVVRLAAETAGRRQFRVQVASSPGVTNWSDLLVCASTGAVTEVCETNTVPTRFYRIISP